MKKLSPLFLLIGIIFLFFLQVIVSSDIWGFRDFHRYVYPIRHFTWESMRSFIIPFWNPYIGCGTPLFAGLQGCVFYPPSILVYLFPYEIGLKIYVIFHFLLAGITSYLLGLQLKLDRAPSFILSLVYTFSGWFVSSIDIPIILASSSWIPIVFLFLIRQSFVLTGIFLSFQFMCGEPSIFYITSILVLLFSLYIRIRWTIPILSILIAFSLSLFQILPFLELLSHSTRLLQGYSESAKWAFSPYEVFRFILPSSCGGIVRGEEEPILWFGQEWLKSPYLGIIPFILALISILYPRKERIVSFFSLTALLFLIISFGNYTPLYKALYPLFSLMRYPVKFLYITSFSASILAGFGTSYLLNKKTNPTKVFIYIGLFICCVFIFPFFKRNDLFSLFSISPIRLIKWWNDLYPDAIFILFLISFSLIFLVLYLSGIIKRNTFVLGFAGIIIIDLFFFGLDLNPLVKREVYDKSNTIRFLEKKDGLFRICLSPRTAQYFTKIRGKTLNEAIKNSKRFVIPNTGMVFGIFEAGCYDSIYLSSYFQLKEAMKRQFSEILRLLSMMNIRFIISRDPLSEKEIKLVYQDRDMFLYENRNYLPRAFFVSDYKVVQNTLGYMLSPEFDPKREVVLEEKPEKKVKSQKSKVKSAVKIIKYEPNRVLIEVDSEMSGFLVLADTYYPGWKAYVKKVKSQKSKVKSEVRIYKANYCFRAVCVPKGKSLMEFRYFPRTFIIGLIGSLVSSITIAGFLIPKK
ncbi:MAG: YfhO family protein [bacterium]